MINADWWTQPDIDGYRKSFEFHQKMTFCGSILPDDIENLDALDHFQLGSPYQLAFAHPNFLKFIAMDTYIGWKCLAQVRLPEEFLFRFLEMKPSLGALSHIFENLHLTSSFLTEALIRFPNFRRMIVLHPKASSLSSQSWLMSLQQSGFDPSIFSRLCHSLRNTSQEEQSTTMQLLEVNSSLELFAFEIRRILKNTLDVKALSKLMVGRSSSRLNRLLDSFVENGIPLVGIMEVSRFGRVLFENFDDRVSFLTNFEIVHIFVQSGPISQTTRYASGELLKLFVKRKRLLNETFWKGLSTSTLERIVEKFSLNRTTQDVNIREQLASSIARCQNIRNLLYIEPDLLRDNKHFSATPILNFEITTTLSQHDSQQQNPETFSVKTLLSLHEVREAGQYLENCLANSAYLSGPLIEGKSLLLRIDKAETIFGLILIDRNGCLLERGGFKNSPLDNRLVAEVQCEVLKILSTLGKTPKRPSESLNARR